MENSSLSEIYLLHVIPFEPPFMLIYRRSPFYSFHINTVELKEKKKVTGVFVFPFVCVQWVPMKPPGCVGGAAL